MSAYVIALVFFTALTTSCSRNNEKSSVRLELPDWQQTVKSKSTSSSATSTTRKLDRIMINISGPGMSPIVHIWERSSSDREPASFNFEVPKGSDRLVQVLAITRDYLQVPGVSETLEGDNFFFYGDQRKSIDQASDSFDLSLNEIMGSNIEGRITGRWLDSSNSGPTDKVVIKFQPPSGAPPMIVSYSEMHGGWFDLFALEGAKFSYELEKAGINLFSNFSLENPDVAWDKNRAFIKIPQHYRNIYSAGDVVARRMVQPGRVVLGFFGPGVSSQQKVCYSLRNAGLEDMYLNSDPGDLAEVQWLGSPTSNSGAGVFSGGVATSLGDCPSDDGERFVNWLKPAEFALRDRGHGAGGFRGAFQVLSSPEPDRSFVSAEYNATNQKVNLTWKFLPGVTGGKGIVGVEIFSRVLPTSSNDGWRDLENDSGIACDRLTKLDQPFISHGKLKGAPVETAAVGNISAVDFVQGRVQIALCPYSAEDRFFAGIIHQNQNSSSPEIAIEFANQQAAPFNNVSPSECYAVKFEYRQAGVPLGAPANINFEIGGVGQGSFHTEDSCSGNAVSSAMISSGQSSVQLYWKAPSYTGPYSIGVQNTPLPQRSLRAVVKGSGDPSKIKLEPELGSPNGETLPLVKGVCYPLTLNLYNANSLTSAGFSSTTVTASISNLNGDLYDNASCSGTSLGTSVTIPPQVTSQMVYYKPSMSATPGSYQASISAGSLEPVVFLYSLAEPEISKLALKRDGRSDAPGDAMFYSGDSGLSCIMARVQAQATNGAPMAVVGSPKSLNITASGGGMLSKDSCTTSSNSISVDMNLNPHGMSEPFWINTGSNDQIDIAATLIGSTPHVSTEFPLFKNPAIEVAGIPNPVAQDFCYPITISLENSVNSTLNLPPGNRVKMNVSAQPGLKLYDNGDCSGSPFSNREILLVGDSGGSALKTLSMGAEDANTQFAITLHPQAGVDKYVTIASQPLDLGVIVNNNNSFSAGACVPFKFKTSTPIASSLSAQNIKLSMTNNVLNDLDIFSNSADCEAGTNGSLMVSTTLPANATESSQSFYFKTGSSFSSGTYTIEYADGVLGVARTAAGNCSSNSCSPAAP